MLRKMTVLVGGILSGCSGLDVGRDYDPTYDFQMVRTWAWASSKPTNVQNISRVSGLNHERIRKAIENELTAKHYRAVDRSAADFLVTHLAVVGQRVEGDGPSSDGSYAGDLRVYEEGTLIVDFISTKENRLIWRGMARAQISLDMTPEDREARINEAVHQMLEGFPPKK